MSGLASVCASYANIYFEMRISNIKASMVDFYPPI